jgi:hypothetical protein
MEIRHQSNSIAMVRSLILRDLNVPELNQSDAGHPTRRLEVLLATRPSNME